MEVEPRLLAAVRRQARVGEVARAFGPALGQVWTFLRAHPGLREGGHNVFLYHHPTLPGAPMEVDFGVEVTRAFEPEGEVRCVSTPGGRAALVVHRGPYERMGEAHAALHAHLATHGLSIGSASWEVYGDHEDDAEKLETTIVYVIAP
jgi:effector-binding domain-containing protein